MKRFLARDRTIVGLLVVLLLFPLCLTEDPGKTGLHLGLPAVKGGDEPHYLVMINSLILDGDLDLKNNYLSAHQGSDQAGRMFAGQPLDHHTCWSDNGTMVNWSELYEPDGARWTRGADGSAVPSRRDGARFDPSGLPEYGGHPAGTALLLAPFLFLLRGTPYVEPTALLCSALAVVAAMLFFRMIIAGYSKDKVLVNVVTLLAFLGTPAWHYGRTLFTEPFLLLFTLGAYAMFLRKERYLLAGAFIGAGMLMKPPFLLLAVPLLILLVARKEGRALLSLCVGPLIATAVILFLNHLMWGGAFRSSLGDHLLGLPFRSLPEILFSFDHGLILFAPVVLAALPGWPAFLRTHRRESWILMSGFLLYFIFMASFMPWVDTNSWCFGPRHLIPVIPLLLPGLIFTFRSPWYQHRAVRAAVLTLCFCSLVINFYGGMQHWKYWADHPLMALLRRMFF